MYELIYYNHIIGYAFGTFIVGDMYQDMVVWEVDYEHHIVYLTD